MNDVALPRARRAGASWLRRIASVAALTMAAQLLTAQAPAWADEPRYDRSVVVDDMMDGGPSLSRAAEAVLLGGDAEFQAYQDGAREAAVEADLRAGAEVLAGMDGPSTRAAALQALSGDVDDIRAFVQGGYDAAWKADERVRVFRVAESGGPTTRAAAQRALAGTPEELNQFLSSGRESAEHADDRLAATRMLTGGSNNSGPILDQAAQRALAGAAEDLTEFLATGQFVARARDAELASVTKLTEQAKEAGETTARESLAAQEASTRAVNAAAEAKKQAQVAAAETKAAGRDAAKASAAAGRAADAAAGAAEAAREAVSASNAAMRAARIASDAARKATTAASLTAQAAARAQQAAALARTDASKAAAARQAAQQARDAAAKARQLDQIKAERDRALAQAEAAGQASKDASGQAAAAATAAAEAGNQSGVSAAQAQRARDAAERARRQAAAAGRAADRAISLARAAAKASDEAFRFAESAAQHAERAAAAAMEAADSAYDASKAAAESTRHAAAAIEASNTAVQAANQAVELEKLARQEDIARLAEATEQGVEAAEDALAADQAAKAVGGEIAEWNRNLTWDTPEEDRVSPATRALLTTASAVGAPTAVMMEHGRRAALDLTKTGGDWSKIAAQDVLSGGEVEMRSWLTEGRRLASGQDDRARAWRLIDTLPDGAEKTAARTALAGDDATVDRFLRTRSYAGKTVKDRAEIYRILETADGNVKAAGERALGGTSADLHQFLRSGQFAARAADERFEVYRVMETGGPEVQAAGQVALAGPVSYISYFLNVTRYKAAQRDAEQAAHVSTVRALIVQAQQYAETALADAAEASRVAAVARKASAEAESWRQKAAASATKAGEYAEDARQSANAAKASANQAAQSAETAKSAANRAQASAESAARSAATATAASRRAAGDARNAANAAYDAKQSALAAGRDAAAADQAAKEASAIYTQALKEDEALRRSTQAGTAFGGDGAALDEHKSWGCLASTDALSANCVGVYKDFAKALVNPQQCASTTERNLGCDMLKDLNTFVQDNPDLLMDMLQFVLGLCGMVPGVGEACDAADAAISFGRGDVLGGLLSVGAAVPVFGWLASGAKMLKNSDKLRNIKNIVRTLMGGCKNSFTEDTPVVMADGTEQPIDEVEKGDEVLATDPETGRSGARPVTDTIVGSGTKSLVAVKVAGGGAVTATSNHPFWVADLRAWVPAGSLEAGQWLRTASGTWAQVEAVEARTAEARVYNLSVAGIPTYYVKAGATPVLVHNCQGSDLAAAYRANQNNGAGINRNIAVAQHDLFGEMDTLYSVSGKHRNPGTVDAPAARQFSTPPGKEWDSEAQILEHYASFLPADARGTIKLYTEAAPCPSCSSVIQQFKNKYPHIKLDISYTWETPEEMQKALRDKRKPK
ncbi:polymorphic toxin-type HINT domain-containing protein [Paractinoplanes hotanensis]|uniref:Polymorphic toxin-type HINT domain-containing protein n=1 Tax=Paractinoplanes hotanensis TaxID=2906497 RepID=A0ABT0Y1L1_9ACTN|nr:polymorphic toxin-type HINT domain-containing protein [Actinoplanes hotanensis]MCM4079926.1 polymorphic toxin-type HINT domain-containing protein [Actinoplanes hotanensis]